MNHQSPKYHVGQVVTLRSGTKHRIYAIYGFKPERGFRYLTMTVKPESGREYGPWRNITDRTPVTGTL